MVVILTAQALEADEKCKCRSSWVASEQAFTKTPVNFDYQLPFIQKAVQRAGSTTIITSRDGGLPRRPELSIHRSCLKRVTTCGQVVTTEFKVVDMTETDLMTSVIKANLKSALNFRTVRRAGYHSRPTTVQSILRLGSQCVKTLL